MTICRCLGCSYHNRSDSIWQKNKNKFSYNNYIVFRVCYLPVIYLVDHRYFGRLSTLNSTLVHFSNFFYECVTIYCQNPCHRYKQHHHQYNDQQMADSRCNQTHCPPSFHIKPDISNIRPTKRNTMSIVIGKCYRSQIGMRRFIWFAN